MADVDPHPVREERDVDASVEASITPYGKSVEPGVKKSAGNTESVFSGPQTDAALHTDADVCSNPSDSTTRRERC